MDESSQIIATARTVRGVLDRPEATGGIEQASADRMQAATALALMARVRAAIDKAQAKVGDSVIAVPSAEDDAAREAA
jgi:hypothetical protein